MKPAALFAIGLLSLAACRPAPERPSPPTDATLALTEFSVETRQDVGDPWSVQRGADGGVLILLRYRLVNEGEVPAPVTAVPAVRLISPSGMEFLADPGLTEVFLSEVNSGINAKRDGEINPGVSTSDGLIFDVSRESWEKPGWTIGVDGVPDRIPLTMPGTASGRLIAAPATSSPPERFSSMDQSRTPPFFADDISNLRATRRHLERAAKAVDRLIDRGPTSSPDTRLAKAAQRPANPRHH